MDASNSGGGGCGDSSAQAEVKSVVSLSPSGRTRDICSNIIMVQFTKPRTKPKQTSQCTPPASFLYDWAVGWRSIVRLQNTNLLMRPTTKFLISRLIDSSTIHAITDTAVDILVVEVVFSWAGRSVYYYSAVVMMATQQQQTFQCSDLLSWTLPGLKSQR